MHVEPAIAHALNHPDGEAPIPLAPALPTPVERQAQGKACRGKVSRSTQAEWRPAADRPDPIAILEETNCARLPHLVPIRYGRMLQSPFAYLRGSPAVMVNDLARTPVTGLRVQACGDAHLGNFGVYLSPEKHLLFDLNDFDETLPGPWEWDVKRLATSFVVAGRCRGFRAAACADAARQCARSYRLRLRAYSRMRLLDVWYSQVDAEAALSIFRRGGPRDLDRAVARATHHVGLQPLRKMTVLQDERLQLLETPPTITHVQDEHLSRLLRTLFRSYYASLLDDRRQLLDRYRFLDFAMKVVGVGSVGTRCYVVLLDSSHHNDSLLLQIKEAQESILQRHVGPPPYAHQGRRVVNGQRLLQAATDIFLGWASMGGHEFYFRKLRDVKAMADPQRLSASELCEYAGLCGWVLARAHARSGDAAMLTGYLGTSDRFDEAIVRFARAYADQTERDFAALQAAVRKGRLVAETGI